MREIINPGIYRPRYQFIKFTLLDGGLVYVCASKITWVTPREGEGCIIECGGSSVSVQESVDEVMRWIGGSNG